MSRKKKTPAAPNAKVPVIQIGSRVRCTDDGVVGRIVWTNGTSVKVRWQDGEQVTWRRDALAGKPVEILDLATGGDDSPRTEAPGEVSVSEPDIATELAETNPQQMPGMAEQVVPTDGAVEPASQVQEHTPAATEVIVSEPASPSTERRKDNPAESTSLSSVSAKPKRPRQVSGEPKANKLSALDAAAKVLVEEGRAMTCQEMIEAMAAKGYWTSPNGRTPQGTLYSAILREMAAKGSAARFQKVERGKFARPAGS
jgi:hypothetical protein